MAGVLVWRGRMPVAVVLLLGLSVITQARVLSSRFDDAVARTMAAFGTAVGHVVGWVLLTLVFVVVVLPVALLTLFVRRPLGRRGRWSSHAAASARPTKTFAADRTHIREPRRRPAILTAAGAVAVVMVLDVLAGAVLSGTHALEPIDRGDVRRVFLESQRHHGTPAVWADEPFAQELDEELVDFQLTRGDFQAEPFLSTRFHGFHGRYVNTTDEERQSFEPALPAGERPLRVAFLGGSVMFGLGQRDDHTIPSEFARLADEHGVPVEVHNYGLPRWVSWQELLYLERRLADGERFDLVVFLDGYNEFLVQSLSYLPDPTHYTAAGVAELIDDLRDDRGTEPGFVDGLGELVDTYHRNSALWRVVDDLRGQQAPLPGSTTAVHASPEDQTAAALDVYARAVALAALLGEDHGVPVRFFWQPRREGWPENVIDELPDGVTDLSHVFDGSEDDLYYDDVHTNERGARLLAEALWAELGPYMTTL